MAKSSLRFRILALFWGLLLAVFIPMYVFLAQTVRSDLIDHGQDRAQKLLNATCWQFLSAGFHGDEAAMQAWATEIGGRMDVRLTYTVNGRVAADSHVRADRLAEVEDHGTRPEIMVAREGRVGTDIRLSGTIGRDLIYVAQRCPMGDETAGVLRIALPLSNLYDQVDILKKRFFIILGICLIVSLLLSFWFTQTIFSSIRRLINLVSDVGKGAYDRRLHVDRGSEFSPLAEAVNTMAEEISRHVNHMEEQKAQLEALFNGLSEAVLTLGQNGRIVSANPAFRKFFPKLQKLEGKTILEATLEPELASAMERVLHGMSDQEERLLLHRPGGNELEARINTYQDPSGGQRAVLVVQDVSLPRRMEKIRRDFVANVSHEMRTPLTSIKGYTETLLGDPPPDPETARSFLRIIQRNAEHMANIVTDLLKLARLEAEAPSNTLEIMDAAESLRSAMEMCAPLAQGKQIRFENNLESGRSQRGAPGGAPEGAWVLGDKSRLVQVFQNILENAIRFSPEKGKVTISCRPDGEYMVFAIRDHGAGIPREHQERLFERFYRQDAARSEGNGGTGLGLAICKHIVRHHGGRIWVESIPGEGATFLFTLKAAQQGRKSGAS
nr:ATP-binding protein [Desulfonatronum lacustre]